MPGGRFAWDFDLAASKLCGAVPTNSPAGQMPFRRCWLVVDPTLYVLSRFDFLADNDHEVFFAGLETLPHPQNFAGVEIPGVRGRAVSFPEYNTRGYKALPGWAIVFPGAALHAVSRVSSGRRYAFLPFVYDEVGAEIRARNMDRLSLTA